MANFETKANKILDEITTEIIHDLAQYSYLNEEDRSYLMIEFTYRKIKDFVSTNTNKYVSAGLIKLFSTTARKHPKKIFSLLDIYRKSPALDKDLDPVRTANIVEAEVLDNLENYVNYENILNKDKELKNNFDTVNSENIDDFLLELRVGTENISDDTLVSKLFDLHDYWEKIFKTLKLYEENPDADKYFTLEKLDQDLNDLSKCMRTDLQTWKHYLTLLEDAKENMISPLFLNRLNPIYEHWVHRYNEKIEFDKSELDYKNKIIN